MTAEADPEGEAQPDLACRGPRRTLTGRLVRAAAALGVGVVLISGCTPGAVSSVVSTVSTVDGRPAAPAIRSAIDAVNATAGGSVAGQQAVLAAVVDPALSDAFRQCSPATTTLRFEPVYTGLRATPDWTGPDGTPAGTLYALPVLIRIYSGDRITGTDLTTVHVGVHGGAASITPLCVG